MSSSRNQRGGCYRTTSGATSSGRWRSRAWARCAPTWSDRPRADPRYPSAVMAQKLIELEVPQEKAFLVAVDTAAAAGSSAEDSLADLATLAITAGADVVGAEWQNRRHVDPHWYVGKGKAEELSQAKSETGFDVLLAPD